MFTTVIALLAASSAIAAPLTQVERGTKATPNHYAEGYLESYDQYHTRYLSIGCSGKQGTTFFNDCCRPLLSSQTTADQPSYCPAGYDASASGSSASSQASSAAAPAYSAPVSAAAAVAVAPASSSAAAAPSSAAAPASSAAAPAASSAAPSTGGSTHTGGFATYFYQNGNPGACGNWNSDSGLGVAIDGNGFWQNYGVQSDHCGKWVNIKNTKNGKTVKAQIWDVCPTCVNDNSLDLSVGAFNAIATPDEGMVPIEWSWA